MCYQSGHQPAADTIRDLAWTQAAAAGRGDTMAQAAIEQEQPTGEPPSKRM